MKKNGNVLETALEDSGRPLTTAQTSSLKTAIERLNSAAPAEIKSDVQTMTSVDLALLNGDRSAVKKVDDPQVGNAVKAYATYMRQHCIAR